MTKDQVAEPLFKGTVLQNIPAGTVRKRIAVELPKITSCGFGDPFRRRRLRRPRSYTGIQYKTERLSGICRRNLQKNGLSLRRMDQRDSLILRKFNAETPFRHSIAETHDPSSSAEQILRTALRLIGINRYRIPATVDQRLRSAEIAAPQVEIQPEFFSIRK